MATVLLIVDHDRAVAESLAAQLNAPPFAGQFHVSVATTLEEALAAFEGAPVEVLVSDLNVAGTQLAEFARSRFPELKVVFTANEPSADVESQVRSAAGLGPVLKPLRAENVVALLAAAAAPVAPPPPPPEPEPVPVAAPPPPPPQETPAPVVAAAPPPPPPPPAPVASAPRVAVKVATATPAPAPAAPRAVAATPKVATATPAPVVAAKPPTTTSAPKVVAKATPPQPGPTVMAKVPTVAPAPKPVVATPAATPPPAQPRVATVVAKATPPAAPPPPAQPRVATVVAKAVPPPAPPAAPTPTPVAATPAQPRVATVVAKATPPPAAPTAPTPTVAAKPPTAVAAPKVVAATPAAQPPKPATVVAKVSPPQPGPTVAVKAPTAVVASKPAATPVATPQPPGPTVAAKVPTAVGAPKVAAAPRAVATAPQAPAVKPHVAVASQPKVATGASGPRVVAKVPTATPPPAPSHAVAPPLPPPPVTPPDAMSAPAPAELGAVPVQHEEPPPPVPAEFIPPPPPPRRASNPMIGAVLGPYSIKRVLGHGNWGSVFEAVQEQVNRTVAIKVLEPELHEDPAKLAQFSALSSRMANRRHNNIVAVYEAGEFGGTHYYAREFINGRTLQEIAESPEKLSPSHTLRVLMGVARALLYLAHHQMPFGPVPAKNVLVDNANGEPHVCGFSFLDGTSGELGNSAATELPQLARTLWTAMDPAAPQAQQVYALLTRLLTPDHPFPTLEHLLTEAETLEKSFHKPVVKKPKTATTQRPAIKPLVPESKPALQKKHFIVGGAVAGVAALAVAGWFVFQQLNKLPAADVDTFIHVPAGEFTYGDINNPQKKTTKEFWISKYEVTIGQYRKFWMRAGEKGDKSYAHPKQPPGMDSSHTPEDWERTRQSVDANAVLEDGHAFTEDYPIFNVTFWDAYAYAKWAGGRLPTQEEWEKAARGTDGRLYPWGNSFDDPKRANTGKDYDAINNGKIDGYFRWAPVNAHPGDSSPYQVRDMAGNVCEWTDSWVPMKTNPKQQVPVICGGSWGDTEARVTTRQTTVLPGQYHQIIGFRIVRDTPPPGMVSK